MEKYNVYLRKKIVDVDNKAIKLTKLSDTEESHDTNCHVNCKGYGRIRKYKNFSLFLCNEVDGKNKKLLRGLDENLNEYETQVFQIAGCNVRCWYCFVDDCILAADHPSLQWVTIEQMLDMYEEECESNILDLSGGQPDLAPEWCYWVMCELERRGLKDKVYIWLDDNLTTIDVLETCLSEEEIKYMAAYPKHSRACCFKGYDDESFKFNVRNSKISFDSQIKAFKKLYDYGFDIYAYISLTGPSGNANFDKINKFICEIRNIDINLPLRIIPLKIMPFTVTQKRLNDTYENAFEEQIRAYSIWREVMKLYYSEYEMDKAFEDVKIR